MRKIFKTAAMALAIAGLSACATGLPTKVSRFQAMPAPEGQTFYVVPKDADNEGGLEFAQYAEMVSAEMVAQGYQPAASLEEATMRVELGYGVDKGTQRVVPDPFFYDRMSFYDPFYRWRYSPYYSRHRYRTRLGFYYGWDDPFWYSPYGEPVRVYTEYHSQLEVDIRRTADNQALFEGSAKARSRTDELGALVPNLISAMFTDFPGNNGETVKITVKPEKDG